MKDSNLYKWGLRTTVTIAVLGFIFSYMTLFTVAQGFGMNWLQVIIFPFLLDLLMVVSHLVYFYFHTRRQHYGLVSAAMYGSVAFSVAFNLSHASWGFGGDWISGQNASAFLGLVAWALPPVAMLLCVKMVSGMVATEMGLEPARAQAKVARIAKPKKAPAIISPKPAMALQDEAAKLPTAERRQIVAGLLSSDDTLTDAQLAKRFAVDPTTIYRDRKIIDKASPPAGIATNGKH